MTAPPDLDAPAVTRRPLGAQLALLGSRTVDAPADILLRLAQEASATWLGALVLIGRWRAWQTCAVEQARLRDADDVARSAGGKLDTSKWEALYRRQAHHARVTTAVLLAGLAVLVAGSVASVEWGWVQWVGVAGGVFLLWAAHEYRRTWVAGLCPVPVIAATLHGVDQWRWWPAASVAVALLLVCEQVGLRWSPPDTATHTGRPEAGVSFPRLWETIRLRLLEAGVTATRRHIRPIVVDGQESAVAFGVSTREEVTDKAIEAVARELDLGASLVRWTLSAKDAVGELIVYYRDTLAEVPPAPYVPFGSLRYGDRISMGRDDDGTHAAVCIAYTHVLVFGDTGSGKSSIVRLIIDAVEAMPDAEVYGIDLAGASLLGAQRRRLGPGRVAVGAEEIHAADAILDELLGEAQRRNAALLGGEDYDEDGEVDERFLVDDRDGRRAKVLVIGEFTTFCRHPRLVGKLITLGDVARKTAINLVVETPDLSKARLQDGRAILDIAMLTIAMACPFADVVQAFGPGKAAEGWRPDRLQPESEGERHDAGRGYIHGGGRNLPRLTGFHPLPADVAADRRRRRRTERDRWYDAPEPRVPSDPDVIDAEIVTDEDVAREAALRRAIELCGDRPGLPTSEAADALTDDERVIVRAAAPSRPTYFPATRASDRAHRRSSLVTALTGGSDGPDGDRRSDGDLTPP